MKLSQFALLVDAPPKWVQNAAAVLDLRLEYTIPEARRLALARSIAETADVQLKTAYRLAGAATEGPLAISPDAAVTLEIDRSRFESGFLVRLAELDPSEPQRPSRSAGAVAMLEGLAAAEIRFGLVEGGAGELCITYDPAPNNVEPLAAVLAAWGAYPTGVPAGLPFIMDGTQLRVTGTMRLTTVLGEIRIVRAEAFA